MRKQIAELESEIVGARLDAKYLDKELAGRIQQIQILLASNATQEHKQQVWAQIEAEMHLQRSKTIANMCYSKQKLRDQQKPQPTQSEPTEPNGHAKPVNSEIKPCKSRIKQVHLHKHDADELGMAILGGVEHGLPIIISEVFPNSAVGRNQKIYAGDVILGRFYERQFLFLDLYRNFFFLESDLLNILCLLDHFSNFALKIVSENETKTVSYF